MDNYGFLRVAAAVPTVKVADVRSNMEAISVLADKAEAQGASVLVCPELALTGASCGDLFGQQSLLDEVEKVLDVIKMRSRGKLLTWIVGAPVRWNDRLYDCAVVIRNGQIRGVVPKGIPEVSGSFQNRWFADGRALRGCGNLVVVGENAPVLMGNEQLFKIGRTRVAICFGEDLEASDSMAGRLVQAGAQLVLVLSADPEYMGRQAERKRILSARSRNDHAAYVYCNAGCGESTQDLVYGGASMVYENGCLVGEGKRFQTVSSLLLADVDIEKLKMLKQMDLSRHVGKEEVVEQDLGAEVAADLSARFLGKVEPLPFIPKSEEAGYCLEAEAVDLQVNGLLSRLCHIGQPKVVVGVSGGLDSTLALLVCALAFDRLGWGRKGIIGVTMPGFGTSGRTYGNALDFMACLGIEQREISIVPAVKQHFEDIHHDIQVHDVTYENAQARERTQILMDVANQEGGIVLGTGDLSELALGWATYNGDHMSMYGVNASVPKTLVRHLVGWIAKNLFLEDEVGGRPMAEILMDVVDTPVSPELTPADEEGKIAQKTEDIVGPYELHDFFLYQFCHYGFGPKKIYFLARHAFDGQEGRPQYEKGIILQFLRKFYWRFFTQQFKRSCLPDGPKVTDVSLSPRGGYIMPSDAKVKLFLDELDQLS